MPDSGTDGLKFEKRLAKSKKQAGKEIFTESDEDGTSEDEQENLKNSQDDDDSNEEVKSNASDE